jgi:CHAT domain-containing protein
MGMYNEAEDSIVKAAEIIKKSNGENSPAYAIVLNNQGILYQTIGKYKESEQLLEKAISIAEKDLGKKSSNFIRIKINLALLYQSENRYDEAEKIYIEAIDIKKKRLGTNHPDYALLLRNLAALYVIMEQYSKVESNLNKAIQIYKKKLGTQHPSYAAAIYELGRYYQYIGKTDKALPLLNEALDIQKTVLGEHHPSYVATLESLAILYWQNNDFSKSTELYKKVMNEYLYQVNTYFPSMSEYDKTRFWENIYPKFNRFNSFVVDAQNTMPSLIGDMYNYQIATKALLLNATSKVKDRILHCSDTALINKYNQWLTEKEYISKLYTLSKDELAADKINLDSLENDVNWREKNLSKMSELFSQGYDNKPIEFNDIIAKLNNNEAAIEIIRFRHYNKLLTDTAIYYAALVITKESTLPKLMVFPNGNELETTAAKAYKRAMQNAMEGQNFYDTYWSKLDEATSNASNLFVSVDGIYNQINLNTLQQKSGKYLIDDKNIILVSNTKNIIKSTSTSKSISKPLSGKTATLFGDPNYAKDLNWDKVEKMTLPELPGTRIEVNKIAGQLKKSAWKTSLYLGDAATEENIKLVKSPTVLHIATHGFFLTDVNDKKKEKVFGIEPIKAAENPLLRSGLMFTGADNTIQQIETKETQNKDDGILNAYEAMMLNLDKTELVVLSACETGLGEIVNGEGVYGLQRAFEVAGAKNIMISLWEVSDEVTQELMTTFYRNWLISGNKQTAFVKAQLEIKKQYPAPFYWGAFVMVGD